MAIIRTKGVEMRYVAIVAKWIVYLIVSIAIIRVMVSFSETDRGHDIYVGPSN